MLNPLEAVEKIDNAKLEADKKYPIFVSRNILDQLKEHLPYKLYDQLELKFELGFMHEVLGHDNYKEEVETIMKAKKCFAVQEIDYKIKHK